MKLALRTVALLVFALPAAAGAQPPGDVPPAIETHDNRRPAGTLRGGELRITLWVSMGRWSPEGPSGPAFDVAAIGEEGRPLSIPAPLLRAPAGTMITMSIRNALESPLRLEGLCDRPGTCEALVIAPRESREARFTLGAPGTFHYWAATRSLRLGNRPAIESQLGGAIVSDAPDAAPDRVFVLGHRAGAPGTGPGSEATTVINGRSWPHTERLSYATGDTARWRVINLTDIAHAMHLHGFYFHVDGTGDGATDTGYAEAARRLVVTEPLQSGATMAMAWVPERPGNWLFHCHMLVHMMTDRALYADAADAHAAHEPQPGDPTAGMAGLVLGVHVHGPDRTPPAPTSPRRALRMTIDHDTRLGAAPSYRVGLTSGGAAAPRVNDRAAPGPIMVLTRGEPVAIEIDNRLRESTTIHWHGIELDSYDDGVAGFGGTAGSVTPPIAPGGTFTARFTPRRAGTFIYHTHWHNPGQLAGGIYGPIVVIDPGETYRAGRDHVIVIGLEGAYPAEPFLNEPFAVNGEVTPRDLVLAAGVTNRLRFINLTGDTVALTVQHLTRFDPVQWTLVGKDGAATPPGQRTVGASRQAITVGETYDFEVTPLPGPHWLEIRRASGELVKQWRVRVPGVAR
jgi:FtsP/CotA-like multicopper oxidase with cupredoxin domain